jgi:hypothetical protein
MKRAAITGIAGRDGTYLARGLLRRGLLVEQASSLLRNAGFQPAASETSQIGFGETVTRAGRMPAQLHRQDACAIP